jgi:hypothetical protein
MAVDRTDVEKIALVTELHVDAALPEAHAARGPNGAGCCWGIETGMVDVGGVVCRSGLPIEKDPCCDTSGPDKTVA